MQYFKRVLDILLEDISSKLPLLLKMLLSEKSRWQHTTDGEVASRFILSLQQWDPTGNNGTYVPYIVRQLTNGSLRITLNDEEDGPRILAALTYFHKNKNKQNWPLDKDINKIRDWHAIEDQIEQGDLQSNRAEKKSLSSVGVDLVFEMTLPNAEETNYKVYKFIEPESTAIWGYGTRWCTTILRPPTEGQPAPVIEYAPWHPRAGEKREMSVVKLSKEQIGYPQTANGYLNTMGPPGPIYVVFRKNKENQGAVGKGGQFVQIHASSRQIKNHQDLQLRSCTPALDYLLAHWIKADPDAPADFLNNCRKMCGDYKGRP